MPTPGARLAPHLVLLLLNLVWGLSYVVSKFALGTFTAPGLVALRFWLAVVCLLPFLRGNVVADLRAARGAGLAAGAALGLGYLLQMAGMTFTSASMGGLVAGLIVPLVALGGFLLFGARLGRLASLGLLCAMVGIVMVCELHGDSLLGAFLLVGASISYAGHVLLLSHHGKRVPLVAFTIWQLVLVASAGTISAFAFEGVAAVPERGIEWSFELVAAIAYLGVLATGIAILLQVKVQHRIPPTHVALLFATQPLFAALFGWALQGDRLSAMQLTGGALIVVGVVVTSLDR